MPERVRITTPRGLRLRDSARDGATIRVLEPGTEVEVLGRETWLRVRASDSSVGFVLADYTEPIAVPAPAAAVAGPGPEVVLFEHPLFRGESLRIHHDFEVSALAVATIAGRHNVQLHVTSGLREPQLPVAGAVVQPAKFSNHHVGHAFDMNLLLDGELINSVRLARLTELPPRAREFLLEVRTSPPLRWGGDFSVPDPVHIDDGLNVRDPDAFQAKVRRIWGS